MTTLQCPQCGRQQEIDTSLYLEMNRLKALGKRVHPFTCTCGDHIEMMELENYQNNQDNQNNYRISLCRKCWCMTKTTIDGKCGKCGEDKPREE
jgi:hypothetical protein